MKRFFTSLFWLSVTTSSLIFAAEIDRESAQNAKAVDVMSQANAFLERLQKRPLIDAPHDVTRLPEEDLTIEAATTAELKSALLETLESHFVRAFAALDSVHNFLKADKARTQEANTFLYYGALSFVFGCATGQKEFFAIPIGFGMFVLANELVYIGVPAVCAGARKIVNRYCGSYSIEKVFQARTILEKQQQEELVLLVDIATELLGHDSASESAKNFWANDADFARLKILEKEGILGRLKKPFEKCQQFYQSCQSAWRFCLSMDIEDEPIQK